MTAPLRIQLRRTKGWRMPPDTIKVDRTTIWGNPFKIDGSRMSNGDWQVFLCTDGKWAGPPAAFYETKREAAAGAVDLFRQRLAGAQGDLLRKRAVTELRGKNLACWCPPGRPCHADVLLELANA